MTLPTLPSSGALKGIDLLPLIEALEERLTALEDAIEAIRQHRWLNTQLENRR